MDYKNKIESINDKMSKLKEAELKLVESRKIFFGNLLERLELLSTPDALLTGLLLDYKAKLLATPHELKDFEKQGEEYLRCKKKLSYFTTNSQISSAITTYETTTN